MKRGKCIFWLVVTLAFWARVGQAGGEDWVNLGHQIRERVYTQVQQQLAANGIHWSPHRGCVGAVVQQAGPREYHKPPHPQPQAPRPWRPLKELVDWESWLDLVKEGARRVPDLQAIWNWKARTHHSVYFGGGGLRGLLHWQAQQLQRYPVHVVRSMTPPSLAQLMRQPGCDYDLHAPAHVVDQIKLELPQYNGWDFLSLSLNQQNVALGGATLEKVRVSPAYTDDPLHGLSHYYQGLLVFWWTDDAAFNDSYWAREKGNTRLAEAIRYIRMLYNLPEVQADLESIRRIQSIPLHPFQRSANTDYWVAKGLVKLYTATHENSVEYFAVLRKYGLLQMIAEQGYRSSTQVDLTPHLAALSARGFSQQELQWAWKMAGY